MVRQLVARLMAVTVVVELEIVGVDHQQCDRSATAHCAAPFTGQCPVEMPPVGQTCEPISCSENGELPFRGAPMCEFAIEKNRQHLRNEDRTTAQGESEQRSRSLLKKIKSSGAVIERSFPLYSISPRSRSPIEAAQAQHRRQRLLPVTRRFFLDAFTQGVKLLLRDSVNLGGNFHYGHAEKLRRKAQMQFVREVDMLLQRPCH